jgi:peptidoglycan/LPS O-acetylase OafA/YrhL
MRNKRLDVLRCVAVAVVILHHGGISDFFTRVGWAGVDLFFVLSGFLISGLLFSEYKKRGAINFKRFFIRRGLKIYPAFYAFLFLTGVAGYLVFHTHASAANYLHDIFFIMNYQRGVWDHTWSLGVEEHFYIFLPIFLLFLIRLSSNRRDPFRILPWATVAIGALCIIFRAISVDFGNPDFLMAYIASHNRMDALFFGVLLGYFYHFRPAVLESLMRPTINRVAIGVASAIFISFAYLPHLQNGSRFNSTIGFTFIYLGFGGVLLLSLYVHGILPKGAAWMAEKIGGAFAYAGVYSYSIYLWHGPAGAWFPGLMRRALHFPTSKTGIFAAYFVASFGIGIVMSRLIEYPILHLRDRLFPQPQIVAVTPEVTVDPEPAAAD